MKENLTGLFISGLLHVGILGVVANASYLPEKEKKPKTHQLTVSLFQVEKKKIVAPPVLAQSKPKIEAAKQEKLVKLPSEQPPKPVKEKLVLKPVEKLVQAKPITKPITKPEIKTEVKPIVVAAVKPEKAHKKTALKKEKPNIHKAITEPAKSRKSVVIKRKPKPKKKVVKRKQKTKKRVLVRKKVIRKPVRKVVRKIVKKPRVVKPIVRTRPIVRAKASPKPKARKLVRRPRVQPRQYKKLPIRTHKRVQQRTPYRRPNRSQQRPQQRQQRNIRQKPVVHARRITPAKKHVKTGGVVNNRKIVRRPVIARKAVKQPVRKRAIRVATRQTYRKPAQHHTRPPVKRVAPVNSAQLKQYKARLHQIIAGLAKKKYPKRAKRRNQQGKVTLSFSISHSGTITNVRILKGSGFPVLDKAAIKAIQQVSRQLPFLGGMPKKALNLRMTVVYTLH